MSRSDKTLAREYLRVSVDRSGRERSTSEQHDDNERVAAEHGWTLGEPYREANGVSASRYSRKSRDAFGELLADLQADRFDAGVLLLWESSRGSRKVGEWVKMLDLCEQRAMLIHVTTHGRTYDPSNGRDRRTLLEDAVDSEYESSKTSVRARRAAKANAGRGQFHGPPPYGYSRAYDSRTRQATQEPHPDEAPVVVELYERLARGHTLRAIARDFEHRGIRSRGTRGGGVFTGIHLRHLALNPTYMAYRAYRPQGTPRRSLDNLVAGTWPALVSAGMWWDVHRMLTAPQRKTTKPGRAVHLLSRIGVCGVCGGPLTVSFLKGVRRYGCQDSGCVRAAADPIDDYAEKVIVGYLSREDVYEQLTARGDDDAELSKVRADLARARAELEITENAEPQTIHEARMFARTAERQARTVADLEDAERAMTTPPVLRHLLEPGADVAARWRAAEMSTRREVARLLLVPEILGQLRVARGLRVPAQDRVRWGTSSETGQ